MSTEDLQHPALTQTCVLSLLQLVTATSCTCGVASTCMRCLETLYVQQ